MGRSDDSVRPVERLATWLITGPLGHLAGGLLDGGELLARYWWSRLRGRPIHAWDRADGDSPRRG
jgi:hypothetical protein